MKKIFSILMAALFSVGMFATTYTVVGNGCGLSWDQTSSTNDMVADGNVFKLVKEGIELSAGTIEYKIVEDHAWTKSYPQNGNASFTIEKGGKYDVTFTLDLTASPKYSVLAELKEEVVVLPSIAMHGNFTGSWTDTENFTQAENKETASLALTLAAGSYEFGMRIGGPSNWTSNGSAFTRENNSFAIVAGSGNLTLAADVEGEYTFTWTYATNTLAITFPEKGVNPQPVNPIDHVYFATGAGWDADNESSAIWDAETGKITVTLALPKVAAWQGKIFVNAVKAEPGKCYNFSVKMKSNKSLSGATIKWQENNNDPIMVSEINTISLVADEEFVYSKQQIAGVEGNGMLVYDFGYAEAGTVIEIYDLVIVETECPEAEHTYTVAGMENVFGSNWNPADENNDMVKQEDGTYKWEKEGLLLAAGNVEFKVCEDHAWAHCYPAANYSLAIPEAGVYTITITYNPEGNVVAAEAVKTGDAQVDPVVSIAGSMNSWNASADVMVLADDKATASLTLNLAAQTYEFKVVLNGGDWRSNAQEFTRENATAAEMTGNLDNMHLVADIAGEYTFTWTFETNTLVIEFPATVGIDKTDAAIKAIKYFENGQLIIEKNGVKYNAQGTIIK